MRGLLTFAAIGIIGWSASVALASVDVTATVDRNSLNPDDTLTFSISINSSDEVTVNNPVIPPFTDFEVLNQWTAQEARASFVSTPNGPQFKTVRTTRFNYALQPKRQGTLTIGAVEVSVEGHSYNTKPISVKVAPGAGVQAQQQGGRGQPQQMPGGIQPPAGVFDEDDDDVFSQLLRRGNQAAQGGSRTLPINPQDAFFIQVETDKTEAFVGEQVTVSWYIYTRGQIRDLDTLKYPSLKGFWKEDIEIATHLNFTQEVVNGLPYKKALLASYALFPIKEGQVIIDSYTAKCSVIPAIDAFSALGMGKAYTFTKSSQPVKVNVKPLPTDGRPADFSGAVGEFDVSARVDDKSIVEGQPFTLKLRFEGRGNAKLIDVPAFEPPQGLELYDKQNDSRFFRTGTSYKDFSFLLIPRREGEFTIPPIGVAIFDPRSQKYVKKSTEAVRVIVGKGNGTSIPGQSLNLDKNGGTKAEKKSEDPQLLMEWESGSKIPIEAKNSFFALVYVFIFGALFMRARRELGWGERKKDLMRALKARLRRVNAKLDAGDWRGVGTEMTNAVYFVLGEISGEGGAHTELDKLLLKAPPSIRRELAGSLSKQMEIFQVLSFAPEAVVGSLKDPAQLKKAVADMEKLMERAVSLGLSAEQSSGSEANPTTS